jgi:hypothetical protein
VRREAKPDGGQRDGSRGDDLREEIGHVAGVENRQFVHENQCGGPYTKRILFCTFKAGMLLKTKRA